MKSLHYIHLKSPKSGQFYPYRISSPFLLQFKSEVEPKQSFRAITDDRDERRKSSVESLMRLLFFLDMNKSVDVARRLWSGKSLNAPASGKVRRSPDKEESTCSLEENCLIELRK